MKSYNALSTFQHSSAAEKEHMDTSINVLEQKCNEFVYSISENSHNINKSMELSLENSFIGRNADFMDLSVKKTGICMANQMIRL